MTHYQERTVARVLRAFAGKEDVRFYPIDTTNLVYHSWRVPPSHAIQIGSLSAPVVIEDGWIRVVGGADVEVPRKIEKCYRDSAFLQGFAALLKRQVKVIAVRLAERREMAWQSQEKALQQASFRRPWEESLTPLLALCGEDLKVSTNGQRARIKVTFDVDLPKLSEWKKLIQEARCLCS